MNYLGPLISGAAVAFAANSLSLAAFSADWWLFIIAMTVAIQLGKKP